VGLLHLFSTCYLIGGVTPFLHSDVGMKKVCSDGYDLIGSNCYKFYNESVTQKGATDKCREDNAFLASVSSRLEDINEMQRGWVIKGES